MNRNFRFGPGIILMLTVAVLAAAGTRTTLDSPGAEWATLGPPGAEM